MKLYYSPGACSLSPHIISREAGINLDLEQVDNREKKTKSGTDYWSINAKGQVPVLELDNGQRLTEGPVIDLDALPAGQAVDAAVHRLLRLRRGEQVELHASTDPHLVWRQLDVLSPGGYGFAYLQDGPDRWRMQVTRRLAG